MTPDIVISGAGVVSAIGIGKAATLDALLGGRSGIAPVQYLRTDLRDFPVGEVKCSDGEMRSLLEVPEPVSRTTLMGILALQEALQEQVAGA